MKNDKDTPPLHPSPGLRPGEGTGVGPGRKTRGKTSARMVQSARQLRSAPTPAEKRLWQALSDRKLGGAKFRRQHPLGSYVLDFFSVEYQLAVELDGAVHLSPEQQQADQQRTAWLNERGIRVLRFRNQEVLEHLDDVLNKIYDEISPPPAPPLNGVQGRGAGVGSDNTTPPLPPSPGQSPGEGPGVGQEK